MSIFIIKFFENAGVKLRETMDKCKFVVPRCECTADCQGGTACDNAKFTGISEVSDSADLEGDLL